MAKVRVGTGSKAQLGEFTLRFPAGALIFREGDPAADMFIIQAGSVRISRTAGEEEHELAVLEKGDFFGEMALLEDYPERSANATAVTDVELLQLRSADLDEMLQRRPWIAVRMMAKLSERLREANRRLGELSRAGSPAPGEGDAAPVESPPSAAASAEPSVALPPVAGSQGLTARAVLYHEGAGRFFALKPQGDTSLGRHDPVTGVTPDVDLTALDQERTVSRRHAVIREQDGQFTITEVNASTNGTFVNAQKLDPFQPHPLVDGDLVQLALVTLRLRLLTGGG